MILQLDGVQPRLGRDVFIAPSALVIGHATLGDAANIWFGSVVRADVGTIHIGARTNIQDLSMIHVTHDKFTTWIGADVTVGHRAMLHGCRIEDTVLIGMGSIVLDGAVIEPRCIIGAGALIPPGKRIASGSMVMGSPGKVTRQLTDSEMDQFTVSAQHYVNLARRYVTASSVVG